MGWQKFTDTNQRHVDKITVTRTNTFGFPSEFHNNNGISAFKYVVLWYDPDRKTVGFQFTNDEAEKHKYTIIRDKERKYGGSIIATSFFRTNHLNSKLYQGRYDWVKEQHPVAGDLFVITLEENPKFQKEVPDDVGLPPTETTL